MKLRQHCDWKNNICCTISKISYASSNENLVHYVIK